MDTATLLSTLRERDIKMWLEDDRLKCSAPVGALDAKLRELLASRKEELLAFMRRVDAMKKGPAAIVPIKPEGRKRPLFAVSGHGGDVFCLLPLARHLEAEQPVLGVQPPGLDGSSGPLQSVEALAAFEVQQIRHYQSTGPYLIAGHCAGGTIAFEVAQQLMAAGQEVALLALIGSPFPTAFRQIPLLMLRLERHFKALSSGSMANRQQYISSKLQRRMKWLSSLSVIRPAELTSRQRVERATMAACRRYTPRHYAGQIDLFVTADTWHRAHKWVPVAEAVRQHNLEKFEIDELLLGPDVGLLASLLQDRLRSV